MRKYLTELISDMQSSCMRSRSTSAQTNVLAFSRWCSNMFLLLPTPNPSYSFPVCMCVFTDGRSPVVNSSSPSPSHWQLHLSPGYLVIHSPAAQAHLERRLLFPKLHRGCSSLSVFGLCMAQTRWRTYCRKASAGGTPFQSLSAASMRWELSKDPKGER